MIRSDEDKDRFILPRWRPLAEAVQAGELGAIPVSLKLLPTPEDTLKEFEERIREWRWERSVGAAEELVAAAIAFGLKAPDVDNASELIVNQSKVLPASKVLAFGYLGLKAEDDRHISSKEMSIKAHIHRRRKVLKYYPRNSILLTETALLLTQIGSGKAAAKFMRQALALNANNRYVFRSAIRLFNHIDEKEYAHFIIRNSGFIYKDPWLLSAALGLTGYQEPIIDFRKARVLASDANFSPFDRSELASAVATVHLHNGSHKLSRQEFRRSLEAPTENAVAQAEWASRRDSAIHIDSDSIRRTRSFEAEAWEYYLAGNWRSSLYCAENWISLERFDTTPYMLSSFISTSLLGDLDKSLVILDDGLLANPNDPGLLNNVAVAQACKGNIDAAHASFVKAQKLSGVVSKDITLNATAGLIEFRRGNIENGIKLYNMALMGAKKHKMGMQWLRAAAHLAKELDRIDRSSAMYVIKQMEKNIEFFSSRNKKVSPDVIVIRDRIMNNISNSDNSEINTDLFHDLIETSPEVDKASFEL
jgi:tetratricopeptide (TPR) repeat protein